MDRHPAATRADTRRTARRECEGLWDWNLTSNRIHYSPGWIALVGCQPQEIGTTPDEWLGRVHPDDSPRLAHDIEAARREQACDFEFGYRLRHRDGTYRWMRSRGLVVRNDAGEAIRLTGAQADVTAEAVTDTVTGLPNRLLLLERLTQSIGRARQESSFHFAVVLIELGRPADAAGAAHRSADPLLKAAARRLETCLRTPEALPELRQSDLVARVDGDRLAVLLDGLDDPGHARDVGERILARMLEPFTLRSRELRLSPAIGIAVSESGYAQPEEALRDAETALHRARVLGGAHCELFDADVLESRQTVSRMEAELETALHRGEFELVYQPVVSLTANACVGFEALVRWRHPTLGVVSPLDFIPIAERTGAIVPLGAWILQQACQQLKTWQTSIPSAQTLWVSVNVSGVQLRESDLVEQVEEALHRSGLDARHLVLELTEGVAMDNPVAATTLLMRLRAMGIRISIDDFGTGYSSLAYLRQFPVDTLKIDQSFVRRIAHDKDTAAIVSGIITMATELGMHVIAEGVETDDQKEVLQSLRCQSAQGFLFAKPLAPDSVIELLRGGRAVHVDSAAGAAAARPRGGADRLATWFGWPRLQPNRNLAAAAGVTGVLITIGAGAMWLGNRTPARESQIASSATPATSRGPALTEAMAVSPARPAADLEKTSSSESDPGAAPTGSARQAASAAAAGAHAIAPSPRMPAAAVPAPVTYDVVHQHRFGSCRGRLEISSRGVAFVPEKSDSDDGFTLAFAELSHGVDGRTLIIRSAQRIYRFNLRDGNPAAGTVQQVATISDAIVRARR